MNSSAEKSHRPWWAGWLGSALVYTAYAMVASFAMVIGLGFYSHWSHAKENLRIDSRQIIRSVEQAVYHYRTDNPGGCPASVADLVAPLTDPVLRRRARHVLTENARVRVFADALRRLDLPALGPLLAASHTSLRDDFEVSTPVLDALVERLVATPGVLGARLTGAGFGGCVVALTEPGALDVGWRVHAGPGAHRRA